MSIQVSRNSQIGITVVATTVALISAASGLTSLQAATLQETQIVGSESRVQTMIANTSEGEMEACPVVYQQHPNRFRGQLQLMGALSLLGVPSLLMALLWMVWRNPSVKAAIAPVTSEPLPIPGEPKKPELSVPDPVPPHAVTPRDPADEPFSLDDLSSFMDEPLEETSEEDVPESVQVVFSQDAADQWMGELAEYSESMVGDSASDWDEPEDAELSLEELAQMDSLSEVGTPLSRFDINDPQLMAIAPS